MKKILKLSILLGVYASLSKARFSKCKTDEQFTCVRALIAMRPHVEAYEHACREARERLKPDNYDFLAEQASRWDTLSREEQDANNRSARLYNDRVQKFFEDEEAREVEIETGTLSEEAIGRLMASTPDWTVAQAAAVIEFFEET